MSKVFHVTLSDEHVYGVAASNKTEAKLFAQDRLTRNGDTRYPVSAEYVGTGSSWTYGTVLAY